MAELLVINFFPMTWQIIEDMSIQANVPALAMEEVTNLFLGNMDVYQLHLVYHISSCFWE